VSQIRNSTTLLSLACYRTHKLAQRSEIYGYLTSPTMVKQHFSIVPYSMRARQLGRRCAVRLSSAFSLCITTNTNLTSSNERFRALPPSLSFHSLARIQYSSRNRSFRELHTLDICAYIHAPFSHALCSHNGRTHIDVPFPYSY
jgi:hypothetical protein